MRRSETKHGLILDKFMIVYNYFNKISLEGLQFMIRKDKLIQPAT